MPGWSRLPTGSSTARPTSAAPTASGRSSRSTPSAQLQTTMHRFSGERRRDSQLRGDPGHGWKPLWNDLRRRQEPIRQDLQDRRRRERPSPFFTASSGATAQTPTRAYSGRGRKPLRNHVRGWRLRGSGVSDLGLFRRRAALIGPFSPLRICTVAQAGITAGCGGGNFCPDSPVSRAQMAVFLLKSEHTSSYVPPQCAGIFADVPCPSTEAFPYSDWIEQLATEGITGGCFTDPLRYCPDRTVTRAGDGGPIAQEQSMGLVTLRPPASASFRTFCSVRRAWVSPTGSSSSTPRASHRVATPTRSNIARSRQLQGRDGGLHREDVRPAALRALDSSHAGCQLPGDPLKYCPTREVLRSEMAVFLLKSSQGFQIPRPAPASSRTSRAPPVWASRTGSRTFTTTASRPAARLRAIR